MIGYHLRAERCFNIGPWREERISEKKRKEKGGMWGECVGGDDAKSLAFSASSLFIWDAVTFYPTTLDLSKPHACCREAL